MPNGIIHTIVMIAVVINVLRLKDVENAVRICNLSQCKGIEIVYFMYLILTPKSQRCEGSDE